MTEHEQHQRPETLRTKPEAVSNNWHHAVTRDAAWKEIADTLMIPLGTVKSRLSMGVHRLRGMLAPVPEGVD